MSKTIFLSTVDTKLHSTHKVVAQFVRCKQSACKIVFPCSALNYVIFSSSTLNEKRTQKGKRGKWQISHHVHDDVDDDQKRRRDLWGRCAKQKILIKVMSKRGEDDDECPSKEQMLLWILNK